MSKSQSIEEFLNKRDHKEYAKIPGSDYEESQENASSSTFA